MTMTAICFTKEELKKYPLISQIEIGMRVIANDLSYYKGLKGTITEIRYGNEKETDNDTILEIIVDFEEPQYGSLEHLYPELNGTSIGQVIMDEESLGFYFNGNPIAQDAKGQIICPDCHKSLNHVSETQFEDIYWNLEDGKWVKSISDGDSNGKRCPYCDARLDDEESILMY